MPHDQNIYVKHFHYQIWCINIRIKSMNQHVLLAAIDIVCFMVVVACHHYTRCTYRQSCYGWNSTRYAR